MDDTSDVIFQFHSKDSACLYLTKVLACTAYSTLIPSMKPHKDEEFIVIPITNTIRPILNNTYFQFLK